MSLMDTILRRKPEPVITMDEHVRITVQKISEARRLLLDEIAELKAELSALKPDAEKYRASIAPLMAANAARKEAAAAKRKAKQPA